MERIINFIFTTKIFIQLKDKKFIKTSWLYIAYLVAIWIAGFGLVQANKFGFEYTIVDLCFFIPFLGLTVIYIWKYYKPSLEWFEIPGSFSKLDYLASLLGLLQLKRKELKRDWIWILKISTAFSLARASINGTINFSPG